MKKITILLVPLLVLSLILGIIGCDEKEERTAAAPLADFTGEPTTGFAPLEIKFTDQSMGHIITWDWDFGDGQTNRAQNPVHTYAEPGTYTVSLTVTGSEGSDTEVRSQFIEVTIPNLEEESSQTTALNFLLNSPTFKYDGLEDTTKLVVSTALEGETGSWQFEYEFQCENLGYGDRSGDSVVAIVTSHRARIIVKDGEVLQATVDELWDMLSQKRTKLRVMIQPLPWCIEEVKELIQELGGIRMNFYSVGLNGEIITSCILFLMAMGSGAFFERVK